LKEVYAVGETQVPGGSSPPVILTWLPIIFIFIIFYFLLIRPQQKKQKELNNMISKLKKGDEVITTGGIYGTVINVKDKSVILKVDENVTIEFQKSAVTYLKKG
jgi:preprotein translocase subunit YajC